MKTQIIGVEGMFCGHCEIAVQNAVRKLPGVQKAKASKRKKQTVVEYNEAQTSREQIENAIAEAGYTVTGG